MSAFHPIADLIADVLGGPLSAIPDMDSLFDHLVGGDEQLSRADFYSRADTFLTGSSR